MTRRTPLLNGYDTAPRRIMVSCFASIKASWYERARGIIAPCSLHRGAEEPHRATSTEPHARHHRTARSDPPALALEPITSICARTSRQQALRTGDGSKDERWQAAPMRAHLRRRRVPLSALYLLTHVTIPSRPRMRALALFSAALLVELATASPYARNIAYRSPFVNHPKVCRGALLLEGRGG